MIIDVDQHNNNNNYTAVDPLNVVVRSKTVRDKNPALDAIRKINESSMRVNKNLQKKKKKTDDYWKSYLPNKNNNKVNTVNYLTAANSSIK